MALSAPDEAPQPTSPEGASRQRYLLSREQWMALLILALTLAAYVQVMGFRFVSFDDPLYITNNNIIQGGLNAKSLRYAFTTVDDGSYLPLVWLSHAACVSLFHAWAGGHHLVNLLLHAANALLLFGFLNRITRALWSSAAVALLFALHPLHVESVAWVTERKDVLSTLFWILTSWAYVEYLDRPSRSRYLGMVTLFILGLLSKSMLVTLPLTLLLLDGWPLCRFRGSEASLALKVRLLWRLVVEKLPLFLLSATAAAILFYTQRNSGSTNAQSILPVFIRLANALMSVVKYLQQTIWPFHLSAFYPYPEVIYRWRIAGSAALILFLSGVCVLNLRRRPYLAVGWFWFLVTLLPVIGIIQVGSQAHADRYTYIPLIGLFVALCGLTEELALRWQLSQRVVLSVAVPLLTALFTLTAAQAAVWRSSETLWTHALALNSRNYLAQQHLGELYIQEKRFREAYVLYAKACEHLQSYSMFIRLGDLLETMGSPAQALIAYQSAQGPHLEGGQWWASHPLVVDQRIGTNLTRSGRYDEAEPHVRKVIQGSNLATSGLTPEEVQASLIDLAAILKSRNRLLEALRILETALTVDPTSARARTDLDLLHRQMGRCKETLRKPKRDKRRNL